MSNWRELGEVPDSEDEGEHLGKQNFTTDLPLSPVAVATTAGHESDIWEFPSSQEDQQREFAGEEAPLPASSSPLSSALSDGELPVNFSLNSICSRVEYTASSDLGRHSQPRSSSHGNRREDLPDSAAPSQPLQSQELGQDLGLHEYRQAAIRYQRSLRPRKPIQEHPYLLENARYSTILKKHGVKPLKTAVEVAVSRREPTALDADFEETSQKSAQVTRYSKIRRNSVEGFLGGFNEIAFPSSSPPRTSPPRDHVQNSTPASSQSETDNTSVPDQDLPALEELMSRPPRPATMDGTLKRGATQPLFTIRKRRRFYVIDSDPADFDTTPSARPRLTDASPIIRDLELPLELSPSSTQPSPQKVFDISSDDESEVGHASDLGKAQNLSSMKSDSESDADLMNELGHRIRGVLPASWLRLDQQSGRDRAQKDARRQQRHPSPERENRRGIAQKKQALSSAAARPFLFDLFDESSDSETLDRPRKTNVQPSDQTRLTFDAASRTTSTEPIILDDDESVVEDDQIDFMLPGRPTKSRQLKLSDPIRSRRKRSSAVKDSVRANSRKWSKQTRITSQLCRRHGPSKKYLSTGQTGGPTKGPKTARTKRTTLHLPTPPNLGILDMIEPGAPRFLKIAARTAKTKQSKGRSSPRKKVIRLATRQDHVDAVSVLLRWRAGSIPQRPFTTATTLAQEPHSTLPLSEGSGNISASKPIHKPPQMSSDRFIKHIGGEIVSQQSPTKNPPPQHPLVNDTSAQPRMGPTRPAQLERQQIGQMTNAAFHARKRILDRLYRDRHLKIPRLAYMASSAEDMNAPLRAAGPYIGTHSSHQPPRKLGFRKRTKPCRVDLEAPQFSHAHDPLPVQYSPHLEPSKTDGLEGKVLGLGPFGSFYTHHFEVFPLDPRAYFHESTLLGKGIIECFTTESFCERIMDDRPRASFSLGGQLLKWGAFDAQVSSELGVVLDFVAEHIETWSTGESELSDSSSTPVTAAMFVLTYFKDSVGFSHDEEVKSFVERAYECFHSFNERVNPHVQQIMRGPEVNHGMMLRVYDLLLLACLAVLKICRSRPLLMAESFRIEDCLTRMATTLLFALFGLGVTQLRKSYEDLGRPRCRERGLREDSPAVHSWVVIMKTLEIAKIPRATFWELAQTFVAPEEALSSFDARDFERCWEAMFCLLPLTEFNEVGVIVPCRRHEPASDGWTIAQKLLKRVFLLYRQNSRQPPNFNNYCRALVGRCHLLVQQWGWRRSATVIGVIFDFFGSQDLQHLRNEEAYDSPRFLQELAGRPTLDIEPGDLCFHVFLKLIALSIHKLKGMGAVKDVRNMVARTIPNHNRQHHREQNVLARDLAALRNHHDLLSTLFWASPPELRPPVNLIERLVAPASSHKEACLINIRCWNQLARFVVASGEAVRSFKPFIQWRNAFFQQVLRQFDSVAFVVQQQVLSLAKDISTSISDDVIQTAISMNKAAVMDVLYACASASLDVMRHTPDLEAATFALNTLQLQSIFKHFAVAPPALNWGVLRTALATLDSFLGKIDDFKEAEESQQSESHLLDSAQVDDALMLVDQDISPSFFSMARCVLSSPRSRAVSASADLGKGNCLEQIVTLSARMSVRFVNAGAIRPSDMFKSGKYGLFEGPPHKLGLDQRRSLVLFVSTLLKCGMGDLSDSNYGLSKLWALALVKPREYLGYEMQLAQELRRHGKHFVPPAVEGLAVQPDYSTNRDLFEFAVSSMRRRIREAAPSLQKALVAETSKTLKLVMEQIKGDLATMCCEATGHGSYVVFVQSIISLIKTHGADICGVDNYFLQISKEYSPSVQDPNLQVAGLISYGLRLKEGDDRSSQQLFFLLFNNIKFAMINDKLGEEVAMLRRGMKNLGIVDFVLGKMLPAIVRSCFQRGAAFPLLDTYAEALRLVFANKTVDRELDESSLPLVDVVVRAVVEGLFSMSRSGTAVCGAQLHVLRQTMATLNLLWPSIYASSVSNPQCHACEALKRTLGQARGFASAAETHLGHLLRSEETAVEPARLFAGLGSAPSAGFQFGAEVESFTGNILRDMEKSWAVTAKTISIQTPGNHRRGAVSTQGMEIPLWDTRDVAEDLYRRVREWRWWWRRTFGRAAKKSSWRA